MPIADRNLSPGTVLTGRYGGETYRCTVTTSEDGSKLRYRLEDGREFKSPSSAGSAVMGGKSVNGWQFWSLATGTPADTDTAETESKPKAMRGSKSATKGAAAAETA